MPSKITTSVKGLVKEPLTTLKAGINQAKKPANTSNVSLVFIGAVASPVVGFVYNKVFEMIYKLLPAFSLKAKLKMVLRVVLPLVPIYFVRKFNVPFGTLINGTLAGVAVYSFISALFSQFAGKSWQDLFSPKGQNPQSLNAGADPHIKYAEWD